jgi:septation ring formation regulator EzrA
MSYLLIGLLIIAVVAIIGNIYMKRKMGDLFDE